MRRPVPGTLDKVKASGCAMNAQIGANDGTVQSRSGKEESVTRGIVETGEAVPMEVVARNER